MFDVVEVEFVTSSLGGGEESLPVEVGTSFFPRCFPGQPICEILQFV